LTSRGKIEEAEYFLSRFEQVPLDALKHEISAFLSAVRSVFDHMLEDYRTTFDLGDMNRLSERAFRKRAIERHNERAIDFLKWYGERLSALRTNRDYGFLFRKRDHNIHRNSSKEVHMVQWKGQVIFSTEPGTTVTIPLVKPKTLASRSQLNATVTKNGRTASFPIEGTDEVFFEENMRSNIVTVCSTFLEDAKRMVEDAEKTWKTISSDHEPKSSTHYSYHPP
jgi:hypothetical protein